MMEEAIPSASAVNDVPLPQSPGQAAAAPATGASTTAGAPGGSLFTPGFVSPLISVREFEGSCVTLLMALQAELNDASLQADDIDLLVDDLKIISDKELVDNFFEKLLQDNVNIRWSFNQIEERNEISNSSILLGSAILCEEGGEFGNSLDGGDAVAMGNLRKIPKHRVERSNASLNSGMDKMGEGNEDLLKSSECKKRKKGRPFDRIVRAAELRMNETSFKQSHYERLRLERENARANACLRSLRVKSEQEGAATRLDNNVKIQACNFFMSPVKIDTVAIDTVQQVLPFEVVLWIEVYHNRTPQQRSKQKSQDFLVLGSQMLTALRDKIYCLTDELMKRAHTSVPSGYFLIENVFYNDLRDASAIDYSIPILEWVNKQEKLDEFETIGMKRARKHHKIPCFLTADMASTQFLDLECHVGMQYLYFHQGDCKHCIVIRDMRLVHKEDVQNTFLYPLLRSPLRVRQRKCSICRIYKAKKVTYDDKMAPESPCFFCNYCYYLLHYSQDGMLLYNDFKVYDYYHE